MEEIEVVCRICGGEGVVNDQYTYPRNTKCTCCDGTGREKIPYENSPRIDTSGSVIG